MKKATTIATNTVVRDRRDVAEGGRLSSIPRTCWREEAMLVMGVDGLTAEQAVAAIEAAGGRVMDLGPQAEGLDVLFALQRLGPGHQGPQGPMSEAALRARAVGGLSREP